MISAFFVLSATAAFAANINSAPPASDFFNNSFEKASELEAYKIKCGRTVGDLKLAQGLTDEQKQVLDVLGKAFKIYKEKIEVIYNGKENKFKLTGEKTNSIGVFNESGDKSLDQTAEAIKNAGKKSIQMVIVGEDLFYNAGDEKEQMGWKYFTDEGSVPILFNVLKYTNIGGLNKDSFKFSKWKVKTAVFDGEYDSDATKSLVDAVIGKDSGLTGNLKPAKMRLYVDGSSGNWTKGEITADVEGSRGTFRVKETCSYIYNDKAKIKKPAKATLIDAAAGIKEFTDLTDNF